MRRARGATATRRPGPAAGCQPQPPRAPAAAAGVSATAAPLGLPMASGAAGVAAALPIAQRQWRACAPQPPRGSPVTPTPLLTGGVLLTLGARGPGCAWWCGAGPWLTAGCCFARGGGDH